MTEYWIKFSHYGTLYNFWNSKHAKFTKRSYSTLSRLSRIGYCRQVSQQQQLCGSIDSHCSFILIYQTLPTMATVCMCVWQVQSVGHRGQLRSRSDKTGVHLLTHHAPFSANRRKHPHIICSYFICNKRRLGLHCNPLRYTIRECIIYM